MMRVQKDSERPSGKGDNEKDLPTGLPKGHSEIRKIEARGRTPESIAAFAETEGIDLLVIYPRSGRIPRKNSCPAASPRK